MSAAGSRAYGARAGGRLRAGLEGGSEAVASATAERFALAGVGVGMVAAAATLLALNSGLTYFNDEYGWLATSGDFRPSTILAPHNSHLIAFPRLLYKTLPELFGPSHLVFAVVSVVGVLLCAGLFFVFARKRIGGLAALPPTLVLLFFGSSWDVVLATVGIPALCSLAGGLGALVALDRDDRRGDVAAALLLVLSLASHSFGPVFVAGILAYLLLRPDRWRRIWIVAVPGALYAAWWVWALKFDQGVISASNVPGLPLYMAKSLGAGLAALTGLNSDFGQVTPPVTQPTRFLTHYMPPLAIAGALALVVRVWMGRLTPWFWALLALLLAYWVAIGLSAGPAREPEAARYLYPSAVMILLLAAEGLRGARLGWAPVALVSVLAAVSLAGNLTHLRNAHNLLVAHADSARAQLAMVELGQEQGDLGLRLSDVSPLGARYVALPAVFYLAVVDRVGSLADDLPEVRAESEPVREGADLVLARYLKLIALPEPDAAPSRCRAVPEGEAFDLRPGINVLRLGRGEQPASLLLGRFADAPTVPVGNLSAPEAFAISVPTDEAPDPWRGQVEAPVWLCR